MIACSVCGGGASVPPRCSCCSGCGLRWPYCGCGLFFGRNVPPEEQEARWKREQEKARESRLRREAAAPSAAPEER